MIAEHGQENNLQHKLGTRKKRGTRDYFFGTVCCKVYRVGGCACMRVLVCVHVCLHALVCMCVHAFVCLHAQMRVCMHVLNHDISVCRPPTYLWQNRTGSLEKPANKSEY